MIRSEMKKRQKERTKKKEPMKNGIRVFVVLVILSSLFLVVLHHVLSRSSGQTRGVLEGEREDMTTAEKKTSKELATKMNSVMNYEKRLSQVSSRVELLRSEIGEMEKRNLEMEVREEVKEKEISECWERVKKIESLERLRLEEVQELEVKQKKEFFPLSQSLFPDKDVTEKLKVCAIMSSFLDYGGVELWFRNLRELIDTNEEMHEFLFFGFYVWDYESKTALKYSAETHVYFFEELESVYRNCDIVFNTAFHPLHDSSIADVLIIHGSPSSYATFRYAKYYNDYDLVVAVSGDSREIIPENEGRDEVYVISSFVEKDVRCKDYEHKYCNNQLLFVGRISPEKRPNLFCKALCELADEGYCGLVIGPYYFKEQQFSCPCANVHYLGPRDDAQCFIKNSQFLLVPSESEGGPIVAMEAWINGIPVVMKKTGLGKQYESSFVIYDWDNYSKETLVRALQTSDVSSIVENGFKASEDFSKPSVASSWLGVLNNAKSILLDRGMILYFSVTNVRGTSIQKHGKAVSAACMGDECEFYVDLYQSSMKVVCFDIRLIHLKGHVSVDFGKTQIHLFNQPLERRCMKSKEETSKIDFVVPHGYVEIVNFQGIWYL